MKKKILLFIFTYIVAIVSTIIVLQAFYNTSISDFRQDYTITSLNFSVNGISAKNIDEGEDESINTHTIDLTSIPLDHNDGFSVDMELAARGTSNGSYAIDYTIIATSSDANDSITPYIMVMQKVNGKYVFVSYLDEFLDNNLNGLVGLNENKTFNYMFTVVPNTNIDFSSESLDLTFEATYNIDVSQEKLDNYPYYYLSNSYEVAGSASSGESIFSKLVNKEAELEGKTIVLTSDFDDFSLNEEIILPFKVGIDLNGHTLDLNGGSITIKPTNSIDTNVYIKDTNGGGSILDGFIYIDSSNDVIKVSDELLSDTESDNYSKIVVVNASVSKFSEIIKDQISEISSTPLIGETDEDTVVNVDVTEGIKFYLKKTFITLDVTESGVTVVNTDIGIYSLNRTEITKNHFLVFDATNESDNSTSTISDSIFTLGNEGEDIGESLLNEIPDEISTSIFLPSYDLSTNSEFYWTTDNQDLFDKNGQYLKNGLEALGTYKNQEVLLTLVTEKNGKFYSTEKIVTIVVFSLEERINLLSLSHQILLSSTGVNVDGVGIFDINDVIKLNNLVNTDEDYLAYMETTYNVTSDLTDISEKVVDVDNQFAEKIGLVSIDIPDVEDVGASQLNIANDDYSYYLSDSDNSAGLNKYYVTVIENEHSSYDSFTLSVNTLPDKEIKFFDFETSYLFYLAENDTITTQVISSILSEVQLQPEASQNEAVDPYNQLMSPLIQYESDMTSSFEEVTRQNSITNVDYDINKYYYLDDDLEKVYEYKTTLVLTSEIEGYSPTYELISIGGVLVADYEGDLPIILTSSTTDSEGNDYTNSDGEVISVYTITMLPSYVPDSDTEIVLSATLDTGNDEPQTYSIPFTMQGIISNSSTGVSDSNLYYELLEAADANADGFLTTLEAKQLEDITFEGSSSKTISSLDGLDYFTNLVNVKLNDNEIINVDVFKELKDLETLDISGNEIVQLESLSNLDSVTDLNVSDNQISDLKPINYLTNLVVLNLSENSIDNFEYISDYYNLDELSVYENPGASEATSEFYLAKIYNNSGGTTDIYRTDDSSVMSFASDAVTVTKVLDSIEIALETNGNIALPQTITKDGTSYSLVYSSTDTSGNIIIFTDSYPYYTYNEPTVDTDVTIFVQATDDNTGTLYSQTMQFPVSMLRDTNPTENIYIETESGVFTRLSEIVIDTRLRSILYSTYNDDSDTTEYVHTYNDGLNSYTYPNSNVISLSERTAIKEPDLEDKGITDLTGINYFSFTKINLTNNEIPDLEPLISVSDLTDLTLGGEAYNYDPLAGLNITTEKSMILENLYLSGTFYLEDIDTLTALYNVYKANSTDFDSELTINTLTSDSYVNIYLTDDLTSPWDPFYDKLKLQAASYQASYNLYELGDKISISKSAVFDFYGDSITFNIDEFGLATSSSIDTSIDSYLSGDFAKKIRIEDNDVEDTFDLYLDYLAGFEGQFLYTINFTSGSFTLDDTTYEVKSSYKVTSPVHIEYNDNYYIMYDDPDDSPDQGEELTKISDIFKGSLLRDYAMTAITYVDSGIINLGTEDSPIYELPSIFLYPVYEADGVTIETDSKIGLMYSNNAYLIDSDNYTYRLNIDGDGENAIDGLRFIYKITFIYSIDSINFKSGIDLQNITKLDIRFSDSDFSTITRDCDSITTILLYNPLGFHLYDLDMKDQGDLNITDPDYYYLNRFKNLSVLQIYRIWTISAQVYDFRGLKGLIGDEGEPNNLTQVWLYGYIGSQYASAKTILDRIYENKQESNSLDFLIGNSVGTANIKETYIPTTALDEDISAVTEYQQVYKDILDFGAEVKVNGETMYHYQDPIQVYDEATSDSITLPGYIKNFGGDINGDDIVDIDTEKESASGVNNDEIEYKVDINGNPYTDANGNVSDIHLDGSSTIKELNDVRKFNVTWYVYTMDKTSTETILGTTLSTSAVKTYTSGLAKYQITNLLSAYSLSDYTFSFNSPLYDTTFVIEGIIGDAINNKEISGLTKKSYVYPITVKGTEAYSTTINSSYGYLIDGKTYYSYRTFREVEFRLTNWLAFNYKDLGSGDLLTYYGSDSKTYGLVSKERVDEVSTIIILGSGDSTISSVGKITTTQIRTDFSAYYSAVAGASSYLNFSINNLDGIGIFQNLTSLTVSSVSSGQLFVELQDISFLQYLDNLTTLSIIGGSFHDLSPIKNCTNLTSITLSYNEFETTYEEVGSTYVSYFQGMQLASLFLDHCPGVTYIDLLALRSNLDSSIIDKYDNTSWITVEKNGEDYTASPVSGLFVGEPNTILTSGDFLDFSYTESSYFVSNYLAMYLLYNRPNSSVDSTSDITSYTSSWTNNSTRYSISKTVFNDSIEAVFEAYYKSTYTTIENGSSFNLGTLSPTLLLSDMGSFDIDGKITDLDDRFKVLPGAYNIPVKYEIPFSTITTSDLFLDFDYYLSASGNTDKIYLVYYDSVSGLDKTVNTNGDVITNVIGDTSRADLRTIFGPTILEYLLINNLGELSPEVVGGQTYVFDVENITSISILDFEFFHSIVGLQYLPNLTSFKNKYNPIVEYPYFSSSLNGENITVFNISNDDNLNDGYRGLNYKYLDTTDLANFRDMINLTKFEATHQIGDFKEDLGVGYSFMDCLTYKFQDLTTLYCAHNGMYYVTYDSAKTLATDGFIADAGTINESETYILINRMFVGGDVNETRDYYTLFGVDKIWSYDSVTEANKASVMYLSIKPYIEIRLGVYYAIGGPISKNFIIDIAYFMAVRYDNFEPTSYKLFEGYDRFLNEGYGNADELVFNYLSIMNRDQNVNGIVITSNRVLLYSQFDQNSIYYLPKAEYFYGHWTTFTYGGNRGTYTAAAGETDKTILTTPSIADGDPSLTFYLSIYFDSGTYRHTNYKTVINPDYGDEIDTVYDFRKYYVEVSAEETTYGDNTGEYNDYIYNSELDPESIRFFVKASIIYGNNNVIWFIYSNYDTVNSSYQKVFYKNNNHSGTYINTADNDDISISTDSISLSSADSLTETVTLSDDLSSYEILTDNCLSLVEQESVTGIYNLQWRYRDRYIGSLNGFERFVNLKEFYSYAYANYTGLQVNTLDLSPLSNLSLTQFHVSGNYEITTNNIYPLLEGSKDSLISFSYICDNKNLTMFDLNLLLGFTNLQFCYFNETEEMNYTNSLSFRNFVSYLYLYRPDLYSHFYVEYDSFYDFRSLYATSSGTWNYSYFTTNAEVFGPDLVNAEILKELSIGNLVDNDYAFIDLEGSTTLSLPSVITRGGIDYEILIESNSSYISIENDVLTVTNKDESPGYGFIKVRLLDSSSKVTTEAERIIFVKF